MELHHFSHRHPLVFTEEQSHKSEKAYCSGCGELVPGPCFSCMECGFYLDKKCVEAPSLVNHPFHCNHSLELLASPPYIGSWAICDFCDKRCENFVYHCPCKLDFHIKCALFSKLIAENKFGELEGISHKAPLISSENHNEELKEAECFACCKPLLDFPCISFDSGFQLHKKCVDLPTEINNLCHSQHPLILQFNSQRLPCQICRGTQPRGFVYCCSSCEFALHIACAEQPNKVNHPCHREHPLILQLNLDSLPCQICHETPAMGSAYCRSICKFALHVKCVSPPPTIKGEIHEHPFTLFWRQVPFICDACGTSGECISYICSTCGLIVHEKCISLKPILRFPRHHHPISHTFILGQRKIKTRECKICPREVNPKHGSYCCSYCDYIVHTNCAQEVYSWYIFDDEFEKMDEQFNNNSAFVVIKETNLGENIVIPTEIKHLSHQHNLVFSDDVKDDKYCDGYMLFISTSFYCCLECGFFLHKSCAESPKKKYYWSHKHQRPLTLILDRIFLCEDCNYEFNIGFAYECGMCDTCFCLRCALILDTTTCRGHEHRLSFYDKWEGQCSGCEAKLSKGYACKDCNFALDYDCVTLPKTILHKCDEHPLILTYHERNIYSEHHYCDICEERRNPNHWFYYFAICNTSVHRECVIDRYSFMKLGKTYTKSDHPHPLTFTRKVYDYPGCCICHQPCLNLAVECLEKGCNYIIHWECIDPL